jgi:hypothetical protein
MIKKRPTLATGHSLAGLPAVTRVLHTDEHCELYSLASSGGSETTLLLVRCPEGSPPVARRLAEWWNTQPPQVLTVLQVLSAGESPANSSGAVLALRGRRLEDESLTEAKQGSLKRLFHAMLDVVDRGLSVQMYPDFNPSLAWLAADEGAMCTLLPLDGPAPPEVDQVRLVAQAFYQFTTGIEPGQVAGGVPALLRWSKFGGQELSRIVDRCLAPASPKEGITTLSGLNNALGRERAEGLNSQDNSSKMRSTPPSSVIGQGLDKVAGMHALKELLRREVVAPIRETVPPIGLRVPDRGDDHTAQKHLESVHASDLVEALSYYGRRW